MPNHRGHVGADADTDLGVAGGAEDQLSAVLDGTDGAMNAALVPIISPATRDFCIALWATERALRRSIEASGRLAAYAEAPHWTDDEPEYRGHTSTLIA
jgi:hypothetical protein